MDEIHIAVDDERLRAFCGKHHIRRLSFFGSVLRKDFRPDSDVDVLIEFEEGYIPGLITLSGMEIELSQIIGRKVDLNTPGFFRPTLRRHVLSEARVHYAA